MTASAFYYYRVLHVLLCHEFTCLPVRTLRQAFHLHIITVDHHHLDHAHKFIDMGNSPKFLIDLDLEMDFLLALMQSIVHHIAWLQMYLLNSLPSISRNCNTYVDLSK